MKSTMFFHSKIFSKFPKTATFNSICVKFSFFAKSGVDLVLAAIVLVSLFYFFGFVKAYAEIHTEDEPENILANGSFEQGIYSSTGSPSDWAWDAWQPSAIPTWDDTQAKSGDKSVKIYAPTPNDARWIQTVAVDSNKLYYLSGWIKTDNVLHNAESVDAGANLSLFGTWIHSAGIFGTQDWTRDSILFNSGSNIQVTIGARLGYWAGTTTGTAWFDELELKPVVPMDPHPSWKILVLIYQETDFEYIDDNDIYHHYVALMTMDEIEQAALAAKQFVEIDIPALTSGNMVPEIVVQFPERKLDKLSPIAGGWWPSPEDTAPERNPEFDSVIVIWDPRATDLTTGNYVWIGYGDGLAANMGTGQTYLSMQVDAAVYRGHRNVFKHEWGHCILFYFDSVGTAPKPTVSNHAEAKDYVNCQTGKFYVWEDETLANPIPNSIYNNESGFTHDYYSGTTATADQPSRCLGIMPEAWALGGPVSHSGNLLQPHEQELLYTPVAPCRIVDTRKTSAGIIGASAQRNFSVYGSGSTISAQGGNSTGCPSPLGEPLAAHINMIAVNPTGKGNLQAFPKGAGTGAGLSVNYNTIDTNLANAGNVKTVTGAGADITVASNFSSAHTVIDVLGYYYPEGDLLYAPVTPCRIIDTRNTSAGIIGTSAQRDFYVYGSGSIIESQGGNFYGCPSPLGEPLAAHINMVAVNPTGKGNLQAFPVGAEAGAGLSVNYNTIDTNLANSGTVKAISGAGPDITVTSNFSSAHTVIDVLGYYYPDGDLLYTPVKPCRIVDTRKTSAGIIGVSTQRNFSVFGTGGTVSAQGGNTGGCPSPLGEPLAAHINMVAVNPTGKGNLQAFPVGAATGAGLSVNYNTIDTNLANAGTVKTATGAGTDITVASNFSSAHTVIDVLGYYYPAP